MSTKNRRQKLKKNQERPSHNNVPAYILAAFGTVYTLYCMYQGPEYFIRSLNALAQLLLSGVILLAR